MITASRAISLWFNTGAPVTGVEAYEEGNPVDRNIYLTLYVVAGIILIQRRVRLGEFIAENPWLSIYLLFCGFGILWSDYLLVSFKRYIKEIGNILIALVVLTEPRPYEAITTMVRRFAYILIPLSIVLYKYFPSLGRVYHRYSGEMHITGVTANKNNLGALCMICGIIMFAILYQSWRENKSLIDKKNRNDLIVFIMTLWLLIQSRSSTSLACFIIGVSLYWMLGTFAIKKRLKSLSTIFILSCVAILFLNNIIDIAGIAISGFGKDETLTGRTELWSYLITKSENPLIGVGYDSYWLGRRIQQLWDMYWWHPTQSHNGYIEIYINIGLIGLFMMIGVLISTLRSTINKLLYDFEFGRIIMSLLIIIVFYNMTETAYKAGHFMYFVFVLAVIKSKQSTFESDYKVMNISLSSQN
jgi:O-antigen ligase